MPALAEYPQCGKCKCRAFHECGIGCHGMNPYTGLDCQCRGWIPASPSNYDNRISGVTGRVPNNWKPSKEYEEALSQWKKEIITEEPHTAPGTVASIFARMEARYAVSTTPLKNDGVVPTSSSIPKTISPPTQMCWCGANSKFKNGWCGICRRT